MALLGKAIETEKRINVDDGVDRAKGQGGGEGHGHDASEIRSYGLRGEG